MIQLIIFIILLISLAGISVVLWKKIPALVQLPQNGTSGIIKSKLVLKVEQKLKDFHFDFFKKQIWLHKLLSWIKCLTLKTEMKIDSLLHGIRKKAQELDKQNGKK